MIFNIIWDFFLYKWSKNKQKRNNIIPTLGNKNNNNQGEILTYIERSIKKEIPISNKNYNHEARNHYTYSKYTNT